MRVAPETFTDLKHNEVFVFFSNMAGFHDWGGEHAWYAYTHGIAPTGKGWGFHGVRKGGRNTGSYAIPYLGLGFENIPLSWVKYYVKYFMQFAVMMPMYSFYVTPLPKEVKRNTAPVKFENMVMLPSNADKLQSPYSPKTLTDKHIAPLLKPATKIDNIYLPQTFIDLYKK